MFCDQCGARVDDATARFCPSCGRSFVAVRAAPSTALPGYGRVARNVRTLGILWMIYAGLRLMGSLAATTFARFTWNYWDDVPFFVPGLLRGIGTGLLIVGVVGALAGWGLMERRPWARTLAIVLGVLALFSFPVGTALGIYTLWVLVPSTSEAEYRSIQRGT
jgi:hypothetical protein